MKKVHYAWIICIACTLTNFCTTGLTTSTFSIYLPYLIRNVNLSQSQSSMILTVISILSLITTFLITYYLKLFDVRLGIFFSMLMGAAGFLIFSFSHSFQMLCAGAVFIGCTYGLGGLASLSILLNRWFESHKGLAFGICATGSGIGVIVVPLIATALIESHSLNYTFRFICITFVVCAVLIWSIMRNQPKDKNLTPLLEEEKKKKKTHHAPSITAVGTTASLIMFLMCILIGISSSPPYQHLPVLLDSGGFDSFAISRMIFISGIAASVGKLAYGHLIDIMGTYKANYILFGLYIAGLFLCVPSNASAPMLTAGAIICFSIGISVLTVGPSVYAKDMSTPENYPKTVRNYQLATKIGSLFLMSVPGIVADKTGSYAPIFVFFGGVAVLCTIITQALYHYAVKHSASKQSSSASAQNHKQSA